MKNCEALRKELFIKDAKQSNQLVKLCKTIQMSIFNQNFTKEFWF